MYKEKIIVTLINAESINDGNKFQDRKEKLHKLFDELNAIKEENNATSIYISFYSDLGYKDVAIRNTEIDMSLRKEDNIVLSKQFYNEGAFYTDEHFHFEKNKKNTLEKIKNNLENISKNKQIVKVIYIDKNNLNINATHITPKENNDKLSSILNEISSKKLTIRA